VLIRLIWAAARRAESANPQAEIGASSECVEQAEKETVTKPLSPSRLRADAGDEPGTTAFREYPARFEFKSGLEAALIQSLTKLVGRPGIEPGTP
jgi:hypothetical protein